MIKVYRKSRKNQLIQRKNKRWLYAKIALQSLFCLACLFLIGYLFAEGLCDLLARQ